MDASQATLAHGCAFVAVTFTSIDYLKKQRDSGALGESREGPASAPLWLSSPTRQNV
ncbi:hypothetical protein [Pseudoalteromonas umbrosa]|uniref:hypothetical protein n=1 Tax=Pseudoalteromonas umbrosa TaxID=3048489 RepID=UPI0024C2752F|nr:hypothetical protein [Pseudoalteromonas sp. B95]MDK1288606.1 hypothetical protein [Pseudoalteromonas sp. B95]